MGWRPIDTAPLDGTQVDLWCRSQFSSGRVPDCWYSIGKWWQYHEGDEDCRVEVCNATHWMPTPEPPGE